MIFQAPGDQVPGAISRDGALLIFIQLSPSNSDLWRINLDGSPDPQAVVATPADEGHPQLSPDGRVMVYQAQEGRNWNLRAQDLINGQQWLLATRSLYPSWSADGKRIVFGRYDRNIYFVEVLGLDPFRWGEPQVFASGYNGANMDSNSDGKRFLVDATSRGDRALAGDIHLVLNWFEEIRRHESQR